ncbi:MAG: hypothetical protein D6814_14700 [Calditrichaeota bacterium]|nr:MAG: hypothetical protein D6814_14700 [Calditrichota bacterium]
MSKDPKYYEFYGELIKSNLFLKRLVVLLVLVNIILVYLSFLGFTRSVETYVIKDGYAYAAEAQKDTRSVHEVRRFTYEFAKDFLEYNRENFNERFKAAMKMCTPELEYFMYESIKNSEIPKIVQNTRGTVKFEVSEIRVKPGDPFKSYVTGRQVFPGMSTIPIKFSLEIMTVPRTQENPFGLRIINFVQEKQ